MVWRRRVMVRARSEDGRERCAGPRTAPARFCAPGGAGACAVGRLSHE
jgi:hypothetical protein